MIRRVGNPGANSENITVLTEAGNAQESNPAANPGHLDTAKRYIPYSNKALKWHTDGYYQDSEIVRSFVLHCVNAPESGGQLSLLDPEMLYILLADTNPDWIKALEDPECFTIPANISGWY